MYAFLINEINLFNLIIRNSIHKNSNSLSSRFIENFYRERLKEYISFGANYYIKDILVSLIIQQQSCLQGRTNILTGFRTLHITLFYKYINFLYCFYIVGIINVKIDLIEENVNSKIQKDVNYTHDNSILSIDICIVIKK